MKTILSTALVLLTVIPAATLSGCGAEEQATPPGNSPPEGLLEEESIEDTLRSSSSTRPAELIWAPFAGGLELTAWAVPEEARVVCLVRNATKGPVACPGAHCLAGLSSVWARPVGAESWTRLGPVSPIPLGGVGPTTRLAPGSELLDDRPLFFSFDASVKPRGLEGTFELQPWHFPLPESWVGDVEIRIACSLPPDPEHYHTPSVRLPVESIRRQRRAIRSEFELMPGLAPGTPSQR